MKQYKVITLAVSGLSNRVFELNDTVTEDAFPEGHADLLVESKHLELIEDEAPVKEVKEVKEAKPKK